VRAEGASDERKGKKDLRFEGNLARLRSSSLLQLLPSLRFDAYSEAISSLALLK
jgi:hypothetical protein